MNAASPAKRRRLFEYGWKAARRCCRSTGSPIRRARTRARCGCRRSRARPRGRKVRRRCALKSALVAGAALADGRLTSRRPQVRREVSESRVAPVRLVRERGPRGGTSASVPGLVRRRSSCSGFGGSSRRGSATQLPERAWWGVPGWCVRKRYVAPRGRRRPFSSPSAALLALPPSATRPA